MSKEIVTLIKQHRELEKKKVRAWGRVYAARTNKESQILAKEAEKIDKQVYRSMTRINKLADDESAEIRSRIRGKKRKARGKR